MRKDWATTISQPDYATGLDLTADWIANTYKKSLDSGELSKLDEFRDTGKGLQEAYVPEVQEASNKSYGQRLGMAKRLIKSQFQALHYPRMDSLVKAGVNTGLGYNFYDLRAPVQLLYPVNTPIRNGMARIGRVNAGFGTAAHWKATRNVGSSYGGVSEGNRAAFAAPDENDYMAVYKGLGGEREVTLEAQWAGEGLADNLADEHLRGLQSVMLQEEGMLLCGNSGSSPTGFKLGTANTPTLTTVSATPTTWGGATTVYVAVVFLTAMGYPRNAQYGYNTAPTVTSGLTPSFTRTNADGSVDTINGGCSAISALSASATGNTTVAVKATVTPKAGTFGYAWYVNTTDNTLANTFLYGFTTTNSIVITGNPTGTQAANAAGLSTDHSYSSLDFDGLLTYAAATSGAYYVDLKGGSLTSQKNGMVTEVETLLQYVFDNFQTGVDVIWGSSDAVMALRQAIRYSGTTATGFQFMTTRDGQNNLLGGFVVSGYQSNYAINNPNGANVIPIVMHPMMPAGTLFFDVTHNPYPHSRIPFVRGLLTRRDYYSIEWPVTTRQYTFGTYVDEVLAHNVPWLSAVITGIGAFVGS